MILPKRRLIVAMLKDCANSAVAELGKLERFDGKVARSLADVVWGKGVSQLGHEVIVD